MDTCLFCKIIHKELPAHVVYEDADTIAVLDAHPRAPGHTMVLPKLHAENILAVPEEKIGPVFLTVKTVAKRLQDVLPCDGLTIGINQGRVSGQMVDHLHVHLIPRWQDDGGASIHSIVSNQPKESLDEIYKKLAV